MFSHLSPRLTYPFDLSDKKFLLRFLRVRNYNVEEAREVMRKYFKVREMYPYCYKSLDVMDPTVYDLMSRGYIFPLYEKDQLGRTVIFVRGAVFKQKYGHQPTDLFRSIIMTLETLLDDEENQKKGFVYIFDQEGVCLSDVTYLGVFELQKLARSGEVSHETNLDTYHLNHNYESLPHLDNNRMLSVFSFTFTQSPSLARST